ncbi:MAG: SHOCT domain-containing protein [Chloroflexota bacterium]
MVRRHALVVDGVRLAPDAPLLGGSCAPPAAGDTGPTPQDVLKTRCGQGEITREEFDQRKADLQ